MLDLDDGLLVALAGRYDIEREIGQGGMAVVYLARDVKLNRRVALKVLRPELANSLGTERFLQEISIAAPLVHPNILAIYDSGEAAGHLYYVMPYVDGLTLRQRLDRELQLPIDEAVGIVKQVAAALDYAHARGVVHRDIKPENILLLGGHVLVADFGLAKAISRAVSQPLTQSGLVVGTPAYMSPEQATPGVALDSRSDIYSLACVTFEMIAGMPPYRGATPQAVLAHHVASDPPALCGERSSCPPHLDAAVRRAMAKVPADRYSSVGLFARALESPAGTPSSPAASVPAIPGAPARATMAMRRRRARIAGASALAALAALALAWAVLRGPLRRQPALDLSTYAVFPFRHAAGVSNVWLDGDGCARKLQDAMSRWSDVRVVDGMRVSDLWARKEPHTVPEALDAARSLSAGRLAWGEVFAAGDSLEIRAVAYDVAKPTQPTRQFVIRVGPSTASLDSGFMALADSILLGGSRDRDHAGSGTKSLRAWQQYEAGRSALDHFDLRDAEQRFREAIAIDESYPQPHLWLARALSWSGEGQPAEWRSDAAHAVALARALTPRDSSHAVALLYLADGRMRDACSSYRSLLATDSLDFAAWFGLGDCNARDTTVVRDAHSPSGYSFRGSFYTAVLAYQRALALLPSYHRAERGAAFQRLSRRVLYTEENRARRGAAVPPDTTAFMAFPSFAADTLAFVPAPYRLNALPAPTATERDAVRWSAETYRQLMEDWVRAFPSSADAQGGYSAALETSSAASGSLARMGEALAAARRAVTLSGTDSARVRRTSAVVRLLLKMDSLSAARALIDSSLRRWPAPDPHQAGYLAAMAALTGRAHLGATLAARAAADTEHVPFVTLAGRQGVYPLPVTASALELRMYASVGGPRDSIRAAFLRTSRQIDTWIPPARRADARQALFRNSFALAYDPSMAKAAPTVRAGPDQLFAMREALATGDTAAVRSASRALAQTAARFLPGSMGTDRLYHHAAVLLALGDTAAAVTQLDATLAALPRVRTILTEVPPQAGAVGRAMLLRAQLARTLGDRPTAERWTRAVYVLWSGADAELRAPIDTLRRQLGLAP
jgi:tRNA A-37 threonylcarbamoyl transferase component Bud32/tetratricopeptide (TPR) repeat protein